MSGDPIIIVDHDPEWQDAFRRLGTALRDAVGDTARRIDHIGSTSIPGLGAKPIVDIQISVPALEPMSYREPIESLGFVWREHNPELTKRYFRETPGARRTHIHVRKHGSWHEQYALLFRDYVREHGDAAARYETVKRELAARYRNERTRYTDAKADVFREIMTLADRWAAATGWEPGPTDA